jgi:hypothetical protein
MSDPAIIDCADVLEMLGRNEPVCLMHEKDLYSMNQLNAFPGEIGRSRKCEEPFRIWPGTLKTVWMKLTTECSGRMDYRIECRQPAALKEFFSVLPSLPITIFVAQHISENAYEQMLTRLKDQAKTWAVQSATDGAKVNPNTVFLVPRDKTVEIRGGVIELKQFVTPELSFNPSIDGVIRSISACHQVGSG